MAPTSIIIIYIVKLVAYEKYVQCYSDRFRCKCSARWPPAVTCRYVCGMTEGDVKRLSLRTVNKELTNSANCEQQACPSPDTELLVHSSLIGNQRRPSDQLWPQLSTEVAATESACECSAAQQEKEMTVCGPERGREHGDTPAGAPSAQAATSNASLWIRRCSTVLEALRASRLIGAHRLRLSLILILLTTLNAASAVA